MENIVYYETRYAKDFSFFSHFMRILALKFATSANMSPVLFLHIISIWVQKTQYLMRFRICLKSYNKDLTNKVFAWKCGVYTLAFSRF